jgi:hypothetical protein
MKTPGGWRAAGRQTVGVMRDALEHAEYDGADKGDGHIRGNNAQSADERSEERHREISWCTSLPKLTLKLANRSGWKKSALLLYRRNVTPGTAADVVKE